MFVDSADQLDDLSDDELWEVAADMRNDADTRHAAISRWLYPDGGTPEDVDGTRMRELMERATVVAEDELEEDDIEELYRPAPYFDGQGRLLIEHEGVQYLIDSDEDDEYEDLS
jgi:hypothetical protein